MKATCARLEGGFSDFGRQPQFPRDPPGYFLWFGRTAKRTQTVEEWPHPAGDFGLSFPLFRHAYTPCNGMKRTRYIVCVAMAKSFPPHPNPLPQAGLGGEGAGCRALSNPESLFPDRQQRGVAARCRGVDGQRAFAGEAQQVVRTAGLGTGAGQAFAAERLHADHRADLVAVDVAVADARVLADVVHGGVD